MGILDDAIREHLDLKRQHGAGDSEVKSLEDEAFGGGDRPDPFAAGELFGEVASPASEPGTGSEEIPGPATPPPGPASGPSEEPTRLVEPTAEPSEGPPSGEPLEPPTAQSPAAPPAEAPAAEPEIESPPPPPEPSSAEPPPESASLEELMAEEDSTEMAAPPPPPPPDTAEAARPGGETAAPPPPEPEAEELPPRELVGEPEPEPEEDEPVAEAEPEVAPEPEAVPPPPPPPPESGPEPPGRARGRVNVPTQEFTPPPAGTDERDALDDALVEEAPEGEPASAEEPVSEVYDFATDEEPFGETSDGDDFEALGPVTDDPVEEEAGETSDFDPTYVRDPDSEEFDAPVPVPETDDHEVAPKEQDDEGEDILAGSPGFVEEGEDEDLWFEKGPPKDFDFEDEEK